MEINIDMQKLIDEVEKRPLLWDLSLPAYSNKPVKTRAWEQVGDACGCTGPQAQGKFKNIRTSYNRRRNKYLPSGSGAPAAVRPSVGAWNLSFLDRVQRRGETTSNLAIPSSQPEAVAGPSNTATHPSQAETLFEPETLLYEMASPAANYEIEWANSETYDTPNFQTPPIATTLTDTSTTATPAIAAPTLATPTAATPPAATPTAATPTTATPTTDTLTQRCRGSQKRRRPDDSAAEDVDSQLLAELGRMREKAASSQHPRDECVVWGNLISAEMAALSPEDRKAFKAKLIRLIGELYE